MAGKSASPKFFGAAGAYSNLPSTAIAQELTSQLAGRAPTTQPQVSSINVIDVAQEQAGKQIDALAAATKSSLSEQISNVGAAASGGGTSKSAPTIVTTATLTATTSATPAKTSGGADTGTGATGASATTGAGATTSATSAATSGAATAPTSTVESETTAALSSGDGAASATPIDASKATEADAAKVDIAASPDEIAKPEPTPAPVVAVVPVVIAPPDTPWLTYVAYALAAIVGLLIVLLVGYMLYTKKSFGETWAAFKGNFSGASSAVK